MSPVSLADFSSDFGSAPITNGNSTHASNGEVTSSDPSESESILVIASQEAAQNGSYQSRVEALSSEGKKCEMHMVDRLLEGGESAGSDERAEREVKRERRLWS